MTRASGHVDRFSDWMVKDEVTGECFRADHLLEDVMKKMAADPKCTPEKKAEYELIAHQVCCLLFIVCCLLFIVYCLYFLLFCSFLYLCCLLFVLFVSFYFDICLFIFCICC